LHSLDGDEALRSLAHPSCAAGIQRYAVCILIAVNIRTPSTSRRPGRPGRLCSQHAGVYDINLPAHIIGGLGLYR